jgi:hypothetical protein
VAKLKVVWQYGFTMVVEPHLCTSEEKSFVYIAEMYIYTSINSFEDWRDLRTIEAVFSSLGGDRPGLTGVSDGLNNSIPDVNICTPIWLRKELFLETIA